MTPPTSEPGPLDTDPAPSSSDATDGSKDSRLVSKKAWSTLLRTVRLPSPRASHLGFALLAYMDPDGLCWPGVRTLGRVLRRNPTTVRAALSELELAGFLLVTWSAGGKTHRFQAAQPVAVTGPAQDLLNGSPLVPVLVQSTGPTQHVNRSYSASEQVLGRTRKRKKQKEAPGQAKASTMNEEPEVGDGKGSRRGRVEPWPEPSANLDPGQWNASTLRARAPKTWGRALELAERRMNEGHQIRSTAAYVRRLVLDEFGDLLGAELVGDSVEEADGDFRCARCDHPAEWYSPSGEPECDGCHGARVAG